MTTIPHSYWHPFEWRFQRLYKPSVFPSYKELAELSSLISSDSKDLSRLALMEKIYQNLMPHIAEGEYQKPLECFKKQINDITDLDLLDHFVTAIVDKRIDEGEGDTLVHLNQVTSLLSYDKMKALIKHKISTKSIEEDQKKSLSDGIDNLQKTLNKTLLEVIPKDRELLGKEKKDAIDRLFTIFKSFLEMFVSAYDFSAESPPPSDRAEAITRLAALYIILEKPLMLLKWLMGKLAKFSPYYWMPYLVLGLITLTGSLGMSSLADWIYQNSKLNYPNLTVEVMKETSHLFAGNDKVVETILDGLEYRLDHPNAQIDLLLGKTGVGKTEIIKEVSRRIAKGARPRLKGTQVYHVNTDDLQLGKGNDGPRIVTGFTLLTRSLKDKKNTSRSIIFFDEVHALKPENISFFGDPSLQFLMAAPHIHCVAATTLENYNKTIAKDDALKRRFNPITVEDLTEEELIPILRQKIYDEPNINTPSDEVLQEVIYASNKLDTPVGQPAKLIGFFETIIKVLLHPQSSEIDSVRNLEAKVNKIRAENLSLGRFGCLDAEALAKRKELSDIEKKLAKSQEIVDEEKANIQKLFTLRRRVRKCMDVMITSAKVLQQYKRGSKIACETEKRYLFLEGYCKDALIKKITEVEKKLKNVVITLNKENVAKILNALLTKPLPFQHG